MKDKDTKKHLEDALSWRTADAHKLTVLELLQMVYHCKEQVTVFKNIEGCVDKELFVDFFTKSLAVYENELLKLSKENSNV